MKWSQVKMGKSTQLNHNNIIVLTVIRLVFKSSYKFSPLLGITIRFHKGTLSLHCIYFLFSPSVQWLRNHILGCTICFYAILTQYDYRIICSYTYSSLHICSFIYYIGILCLYTLYFEKHSNRKQSILNSLKVH